MYTVIFEKRALEELNKLDRQIKERIWNKIQDCKEEPFRYLEPLIEIRGFKLKIGKYRAEIDVDFKEKRLIVLKVGPRKKFYKD
ncbi:MAG: type II toxin-antitoxin system RelE/ParE family toxin [Candidatus Nanoarchaeia archaeon]